jgi:hypothetical protein
MDIEAAELEWEIQRHLSDGTALPESMFCVNGHIHTFLYNDFADVLCLCKYEE